MTPQITDQIREVLVAKQGLPVKVVDEQTQRIYYVIAAEQFEFVRSPFAVGEFHPRETYPFISKSAAEAGWADLS